MMDSFDKAIRAAGVSDKKMMTDTYREVKEVVMKNPEVALADCPEKIKEAASLLQELREMIHETNDHCAIQDRELRESVLAYGDMLAATKNVFGEENMTESVMVAAIQAASYTAYRNIMGQAASNGKRY